MITLAQIHAAQRNDLDGISAVLATLEGRIASLANRTAGRFATNPARFSDYAADFRQDAAVALFEALPKWSGDTADSFVAYAYSYIEAELLDRAHAQRASGAHKVAMSRFKRALILAKGDVFLAERLAQTELPAGERLSADAANACRIAWQGTVPVDKGDGDEAGLINTLAAPVEEFSEEIRPKVGHGAALEALRVLERYAGVSVQRTTPRMFAANLPTLVDALEDNLTVPSETSARRAVLDAMAILRSAVSTAAEGDLAEELRDVADERSDERAAKIGMVHAALDAMAGRQHRQAEALRFSYGISGYPTYGTGDAGDLDGLAKALGVSRIQARDARSRGHKGFAQRYIVRAARTLEEAQRLTEAASVNLGRGGRK